MAFTRVAALLHAALSDVAAGDHHTATVASDLNLADLAARAHGDLSDAPTDAHHTLYTDAEALAAVEAAAEITIQGQITFPSSQSASAGANVLDDYEEGTWTPTILDDDLSASESQAYTVANGYYVKVGRGVSIQCQLEPSSLGDLTAGQGARIGGLPFTSSNRTNQRGGIAVGRCTQMAIAAETAVVGRIAENVSHVEMFLFDATGGVTILTLTEFSADGHIEFSAYYEVA